MLRLFLPFLVFVLLAKHCPAQNETLPKHERPSEEALLVLPLQAAPGTPPEMVYAGVAAQNVIENVVVLHPDLQETWANFHYEKLFPTGQEFQSWISGKTQVAPTGLGNLPQRYVLRGTLRETENRFHAELRLHDRKAKTVETATVRLDLPFLLDFRRGLIALLERARLTVPAAQQSKMLWNETISPQSFSELGKALTLFSFPDETGTNANAGQVLEAALEKSPRSYLLLNSLGWWCVVRRDTGEKARDYLKHALAVNPVGIDAANGMAKSYEKFYLTEAHIWQGISAAIRKQESVQGGVKGGLTVQDVLELGVARGQGVGKGLTFMSLAGAYSDLNQYDAAFAYYEESVQEFRQSNNRDGIVQAALGLGNIYTARGQFSQALASYREALKNQRELHDKSGEARTLDKLGILARKQNAFSTAVTNHQLALALRRELGDRAGQAASLNALGLVLQAQGKLGDALAEYSAALELSKAALDRPGEAAILNNIGLIYASLSDYENAERHLNQALEIKRALKDRGAESAALANLGGIFAAQNKHQAAVVNYLEALKRAEENKDTGSQAILANNLGRAYHSLGQYDEAAKRYNDAMKLSREAYNRAAEAVAIHNFGSLLLDREQPAAAIKMLDWALKIRRDINDRAGQGYTLSTLMSAHRAQGNATVAIFLGKQAIASFQEIRGALGETSAQTRENFIGARTPIYRALADLLIEAGRLPEAEQVLRLLKAEEYLDFQQRDVTRAGVSAEIALTPEEEEQVRKYDEIASEAVRIGVRLAELTPLKAGGSLTIEQEAEYSGLEAKQILVNQRWTIFNRELEVALKNTKRSPNGYINPDDDGLQGKLADLEESGVKAAVVYTLVAPDNYHAILLTSQTRLALRVDEKAETINKAVARLRTGLTDERLDPRQAARELYDIVFCRGQLEKALQDTGVNVVLWFLDGTLRYVPINALYDGNEYLIQKSRLYVVLTSASTKREWRPRATRRVLGLSVSREHKQVKVRDGKGQVLETFDFSPLPAVPAEVKGIVNDPTRGGIGRMEGEILLDTDFTEAALKTSLLKNYNIVHIASHFNLRPGDTTRSFLLLGDGETLSLSDWDTKFNLSRVSLLTLSACETGVAGSSTTREASDTNGSEVDGLGELAQKRGAASVLASLWKVSDPATEELMKNFYSVRVAETDRSLGEALRAAQLELLNGSASSQTIEAERAVRVLRAPSSEPDYPRFSYDPKKPYAHPYFWAPFVLMGNWR